MNEVKNVVQESEHVLIDFEEMDNKIKFAKEIKIQKQVAKMQRLQEEAGKKKDIKARGMSRK